MFQKAIRQNTKIKVAVTGASGSGKTYSALRLATGLAENGRIAVIDTENQSSSLYSEFFDFDICPISPPYTHDKFISAIKEAEVQGYNVVIIDSFSHCWEGTLSFKESLDARGGSTFGNWAEAGKRYKAVLNSKLQSNIHVIAAMRSKTEYLVEKDDKGRSVPKKLGLAPIARDGSEFEFAVVFNLDSAHQAMADKDRTNLFVDKIFQITEDTGRTISEWLKGGVDPSLSLQEELETIGTELYGEAWDSKRKELVRHISGGQLEEASHLSGNQIQRLIDGMRKKMRPEPEMDGVR
ncbi:MAG: AAA family ATPase [Balneolales bacterium]